MASYKRRVDICLYPMPTGSKVAELLNVKRENDTLTFDSAVQKAQFDRKVKQLHKGATK